ncbi:MAG: hypothetical protein PWQ91_1571 [Eubacteriales bacterium]|nr:hypothetical protein [Eubacteriales bacterium]
MEELIYQMEAEFLKALSHPTRIRILELLRAGEKCVCEFTEDLDLEQSNISQHLAVLKKQGILSSRKEGLMVLYRINYPEVLDILDTVKKILRNQVNDTLRVLEGNEKAGNGQRRKKNG